MRRRIRQIRCSSTWPGCTSVGESASWQSARGCAGAHGWMARRLADQVLNHAAVPTRTHVARATRCELACRNRRRMRLIAGWGAAAGLRAAGMAGPALAARRHPPPAAMRCWHIHIATSSLPARWKPAAANSAPAAAAPWKSAWPPCRPTTWTVSPARAPASAWPARAAPIFTSPACRGALWAASLSYPKESSRCWRSSIR